MWMYRKIMETRTMVTAAAQINWDTSTSYRAVSRRIFLSIDEDIPSGLEFDKDVSIDSLSSTRRESSILDGDILSM